MALLLKLALSINLETQTVTVDTNMTDGMAAPVHHIEDAGVVIDYRLAEFQGIVNDLYLGKVDKQLSDPDHCSVKINGHTVISYGKSKDILNEIRELLVGASTFLQAPHQVGSIIHSEEGRKMILGKHFSQQSNLVTVKSNEFNLSLIPHIMSLAKVEA